MVQKMVLVYGIIFIIIINILFIFYVLNLKIKISKISSNNNNNKHSSMFLKALIFYLIFSALSLPFSYKLAGLYIESRLESDKIQYENRENDNNVINITGKIINTPSIINFKTVEYYDVLFYSRNITKYMLIPKDLISDLKKEDYIRLSKYKYHTIDVSR